MATEYSEWVSQAFPDQQDNPDVAGPEADPLGEGIVNLLRYALEIDPAHPNRTGLPSLTEYEGQRTIRFFRSPEKTDIAYIVQASTDLNDWSEVLYDSREDASPNNDGAYMIVQNPGTQSTRFLRLVVIRID